MADANNPVPNPNPDPGPYPEPPRRTRSVVGPVILIAIGVLFLMTTARPGFDPWLILFRYWPVILIFVGLGKIWDYYWTRDHPDPAGRIITGVGIAWILLLILFIAAIWRGGDRSNNNGNWYDGWGSHGRHAWTGQYDQHDSRAIELQGATSVNADLDMPAGMLTLGGGSSRLLDADFRYDDPDEKPEVDYAVSGGQGQLSVRQDRGHDIHFGNDGRDWDLRFGETVPLDLKLEMGAGQGNLRLDGLNVEHLEVHMGAGDLNLDLTSVKNPNLKADIQGGVGHATIRLPKDKGVRVYASGGIGSVNASGMQRDGSAYVNDAYGKSASTMDVTVQGGVGQIDLLVEP
jgi:N-terminal domain of toast_rack, DUF2154/Cell wall-active antibiotics response 4TMS YvqF/Domain of unknown function (DUF5668)